MGENMVGGRDQSITDNGACGQVVYTSGGGAFGGTAGWGWTNYYYEICGVGWSTAVPGQVQSWTAYANSEIDSTTGNGQCAIRYCERSKTEYMDLVEDTQDLTGTEAKHGAGANRCIVEVRNEGQPCYASVDKDGELAFLAGTCSNGECLIKVGAECPSGSGETASKFILENCSSSDRVRKFYTTFFREPSQ